MRGSLAETGLASGRHYFEQGHEASTARVKFIVMVEHSVSLGWQGERVCSE